MAFQPIPIAGNRAGPGNAASQLSSSMPVGRAWMPSAPRPQPREPSLDVPDLLLPPSLPKFVPLLEPPISRSLTNNPSPYLPGGGGGGSPQKDTAKSPHIFAMLTSGEFSTPKRGPDAAPDDSGLMFELGGGMSDLSLDGPESSFVEDGGDDAPSGGATAVAEFVADAEENEAVFVAEDAAVFVPDSA